MGRYQQQTIGPLRGLNEDEDPHILKPNDLVTANNVARYGTMVGTRPGTVLAPPKSIEFLQADSGHVRVAF